MLDVLVPPTEEEIKMKVEIGKEIMTIPCAMKINDNTYYIKDVLVKMTGNTFMVFKGENQVCCELYLSFVDVSKVKEYVVKVINMKGGRDV
jgi:hypothetical protein